MEVRAVTMMEILDARERRAQKQAALLGQYQRPLICFTMNIAGPVKVTPLIERGFHHGCRELELQLQRVRGTVLHREILVQPAGCEAYYVTDLSAHQLKQLTVELEEASELGRLYDMDVLDADGKKLDRAGERTCLICGQPCRACARSRAHTVEQLQSRTNRILQDSMARLDRETAAELACRALLYEVCVTPKPGLVDRINSGSHRDMDLFTFMNSTAALWPYFVRCVQIGQETADRPAEETFQRLRDSGKQAERAMLAATGGVNTHKGAVFSMGVICGALGRLERRAWRCAETVLQVCAAMTRGLTARELGRLTAQTAGTAGERHYVQHGATGIRGQMEAGLPAVANHGLPILEQELAAGKSKDEAGTAALLALIAAAEDTNLLTRGGPEGQRWAVEAVQSQRDLYALDQAFIERNLSPGGCADLLAVCWLLHFLREDS